MNGGEFIQRAKEYIGHQLGLNRAQWEYNGILPLRDAKSLTYVIEVLNHENPNARIQAARVLRLYEGDSLDYVLGCLDDHLDDHGQNRVGSAFQCEENESVCVCDEIEATIRVLRQRG